MPLISSAPGIFTALLGLVKTAAEDQEDPIQVFPFELGQYEPATYIMVTEIANHLFVWESIGSFSQKEFYDIRGKATVFSGDALATNPTLASTVLTETYALFEACVMSPLMAKRDMPILGTEGPTPYLMLPSYARYVGNPGEMAGGQAGWSGTIDWSFHFEAYLTPT